MSLEDLKQEALSSSTSLKKLKEIATISNELAKLVASNPVADSQLLDEIALQARNNRDTETQRAIALNPNTSEKLLVKLAYKFPEEFFANPVCDLSMILENSNFGNLNHTKLPLRLVYAANATEYFLEFVIDIAIKNLQAVQKQKYFQNLSLEKQYTVYADYHKHDKNIIHSPFIHYSRRYWEWREILYIIAVHENTSKKMLEKLSLVEDLIISEISKLSLKYFYEKTRHNNKIAFWNRVALQNKINLIKFTPYKLIYKLVQLPNISTDFIDAVSELKGATRILHVVANHPNTSKKALEKLVTNQETLIAEAAKLRINYQKELIENWKELAIQKINRTQSRPLKSDEAVELRLWFAGIINQESLIYLDNKFSKNCIATLFYIICFDDTPKCILDYIEKKYAASKLVIEGVAYLKEKNSLIIKNIPKSFPINIDYSEVANSCKWLLAPPVYNIDILFKKLEDLNWRKKIKWIVLIKKPSFIQCIIKRIEGQNRTKNYKYYYPRNMLKSWDVTVYPKNESILYALSNVEYYGLILAKSSLTSGDILADLAQHKIKEVRIIVASHPNVTQNSLYKLISDRDIEVRKAALANPKLDSTFKQEFVSLEDSNLSLAELQELANSKYKIIREKVASHPNVDKDILIKLSYDKFIIKTAIAKNYKTPVDILVRFANHPKQELRLAVASNPNTPLDSLVELTTKKTKSNGHPFTSVELAALKTLLKHHPDEAIPILDRCLKYPDRPSYARFLVLMNPNISSKFLARYYKSWFWIERYAIAQNPNTDTEIRQYLASDCNRLVRAAARSFLE